MEFLASLGASIFILCLILGGLGSIPLFVGAARGKLGAGVFWFLATPITWAALQVVAGVLAGMFVSSEAAEAMPEDSRVVFGVGVAGLGTCASWLAAFLVPAYGTYSIMAPKRRYREERRRRRKRARLESIPPRAAPSAPEPVRVRFCSGCRESIPWEALHCQHCGHRQGST